jgi:hypothetical protein
LIGENEVAAQPAKRRAEKNAELERAIISPPKILCDY